MSGGSLLDPIRHSEPWSGNKETSYDRIWQRKVLGNIFGTNRFYYILDSETACKSFVGQL